jgi:hypothetical protein
VIWGKISGKQGKKWPLQSINHQKPSENVFFATGIMGRMKDNEDGKQWKMANNGR